MLLKSAEIEEQFPFKLAFDDSDWNCVEYANAFLHNYLNDESFDQLVPVDNKLFGPPWTIGVEFESATARDFGAVSFADDESISLRTSAQEFL